MSSSGSSLQWGHVNEDVEEAAIDLRGRPAEHPFNGATSMKTWKRMRTSSRPTSYDAFNGATSMKTWKRFASHSRIFPAVSLQWGHVNEDVEEGGTAA